MKNAINLYKSNMIRAAVLAVRVAGLLLMVLICL